MEYKHLGRPCRNFCIFEAVLINDPVDFRLKLVLTSFVASGTGTLIFIDVLTGDGEIVELPGDEGAWALLNLNDEKLIVGTCSRYGYLHCLDLKTRKWAEPLRDQNETYIWNLAAGSDGMVYGGTYPDCRLLRYNPEKHTLENLGRASEDEGNMYSRRVFGGVYGKIYMNCGCKTTHIVEWDMERKSFRRVFKPDAQIERITNDFICINEGKTLGYYDPVSLAQMDAREFVTNDAGENYIKASPLVGAEDGSIAGVRGQEYFFMKSCEKEPVLKRIPVQPPATAILTIAPDSHGKLWGSSALGQTIFSYNTESGEYWNSVDVCDNGGEVYGICYINNMVFMSAYCNGDHIVYDPSKSWDRSENRNPMTLKSLAPELIRPSARSTVGPDGAFWTGWMSRYGTYGGGLSRVDAHTFEVASWYDPVPGQALAAITADQKYIYFTTYGYANGLSTKTGPFHLGVWDPKNGMAATLQLPDGTIPWDVEVAGRYLLVIAGNEIRIFGCATLELEKIVKIERECTCMAVVDEKCIVLFLQNEIRILNPETGTFSGSVYIPGNVHTAAVDACGRLYFAIGSDLYELLWGHSCGKNICS